MSRSTSRALVGAALLALLPLGDRQRPRRAGLGVARPRRGRRRFAVPARRSLHARTSRPTGPRSRCATPTARPSRAGERTPTRPASSASTLPPLEPGTYEVRWVTFSTEDDELARGRYRFSVTAAPATPAPTAVAEPSCPPEPAASSPAAAASPVVPSAPPPAVAVRGRAAHRSRALRRAWPRAGAPSPRRRSQASRRPTVPTPA